MQRDRNAGCHCWLVYQYVGGRWVLTGGALSRGHCKSKAPLNGSCFFCLVWADREAQGSGLSP